MRTFKSGLYKIKTDKHPDGISVFDHIHHSRFLGTHKGFNDQKQPAWIVNHIPTSCQIIYVDSFGEAKQFIKRIAHLDWNFASTRCATFFRTAATLREMAVRPIVIRPT